ncbi:ABC transporter ATP-binding protein [Carnobacterium divergens]|uniref:ABC transporter ATP-binding protein n=1 Tax=Carnobacterium divergens TaxID=2748 RepID=UPI00289268E3|nr:ABC transporter ATP-binding protein [Carnobacterium divergens]MDT2010937.1 ABC transporter ATP-binding protein [Carnobacterium divergens]
MLKITNLTKSFGEGEAYQQVLKGINLEIENGEFVVMVGPSGSGKSTFLNILGLNDNPDSGTILFNGRNLEDLKGKELLKFRRHDLGFVFQNYQLIPNLSVQENIEIPKKMAKQSFTINEILGKVGMLDHKDKMPYELSGGQQQRVAIARALVKRPQLLICDEPTGALDTENGMIIMNLLKELCAEFKFTIVMVTHDPRYVDFGNKKVEMIDGVINNIIESR